MVGRRKDVGSHCPFVEHKTNPNCPTSDLEDHAALGDYSDERCPPR